MYNEDYLNNDNEYDDDVIGLDINSIVTNKIKEKINSLEKTIFDCNESYGKLTEKYYNLVKENGLLNKKISDVDNVIELMTGIKNKYKSITNGPQDNEGWYDSKQKNQFLFIEKILLNLFNIKKEQNGWLSYSGDGKLAVYLAVNYYSNKKVVCSLLKLLTEDTARDVDFIEQFKMPCDWEKSDVLEFVKDPQYNTNRAMYGVSRYWIEYGAGKGNLPHDLIMGNKHILDTDVFNELLNTILKRKGQWYSLFMVYKCTEISEENIKKLGDTLPTFKNGDLEYDSVKMFIGDNILKFSDETLNFLFKYIRSDNHYNSLHWENFPVKYQMQFLDSKDIDFVLRTVSGCSCKWTTEQKDEYLKLRYSKQ